MKQPIDTEPGQVLTLPVHRQREPELTYAQLAAELLVSDRWLRYRVKEGLPSRIDYVGRRRFKLSEVRPWLDQWQRRREA